jgi:hypothetical protein
MTVLLHTGNDSKIKLLLYATVRSPTMDHQGQKHRGVDLLRCAFLVYIATIES